MKRLPSRKITEFLLVLCIMPLLSGCGLGFLGGLGGLFALGAVGGAVGGSNSNSSENGNLNNPTLHVLNLINNEIPGETNRHTDFNEDNTEELDVDHHDEIEAALNDQQSEAAVAPEPASLILLGSGMGAMVYRRMRFKKRV